MTSKKIYLSIAASFFLLVLLPLHILLIAGCFYLVYQVCKFALTCSLVVFAISLMIYPYLVIAFLLSVVVIFLYFKLKTK